MISYLVVSYVACIVYYCCGVLSSYIVSEIYCVICQLPNLPYNVSLTTRVVQSKSLFFLLGVIICYELYKPPNSLFNVLFCSSISSFWRGGHHVSGSEVCEK